MSENLRRRGGDGWKFRQKLGDFRVEFGVGRFFDGVETEIFVDEKRGFPLRRGELFGEVASILNAVGIFRRPKRNDRLAAEVGFAQITDERGGNDAAPSRAADKKAVVSAQILALVGDFREAVESAFLLGALGGRFRLARVRFERFDGVKVGAQRLREAFCDPFRLARIGVINDKVARFCRSRRF